MGRAAAFVVLLVPAVLLSGCTDENGAGATPDLGNHFQATEERPYSFDYPSDWVLGDESGGDVALAVDDSMGMVLEPVHPWAGVGAFGRQGSERVEVDGYEAYRMVLGRPGEHGVAFRINASGTDVTVWFFAGDAATYDEPLFDSIMRSFRIDEGFLRTD